MTNYSIETVQAQLPQLIEKLQPGEEIVMVQDNKPVARLIAQPKAERSDRKLGTLKGSVVYMAPDFDAPFDDFKEYRP